MEIKNIAKLSSYGAYIDEEFIYTNSLVEGKNVIVGNIAEYMYDLEQELAKKESYTAKEILTELKPIIISYLEEYMINGGEEAPKYFESLCKKYGVDL